LHLFVEFGCDELTYRSCFETLLNQGLVMAKDTCEATITKRLAWLVEPLVVSRHGFSLSFYFILDIFQKPQISYLLCFPLLRVSPYSSLFILYFLFFWFFKTL